MLAVKLAQQRNCFCNDLFLHLGTTKVSDAAKPLDFLPPVSRGAFLEVFHSALIVLGTTGLAFAIYTILQQCNLGMSSLSEGSLVLVGVRVGLIQGGSSEITVLVFRGRT